MKPVLLLSLALVATGAYGQAEDQDADQGQGAVSESSGEALTVRQEYERQEAEAAQKGSAGFFQRSADNVTSQLKADWLRVDGLFDLGPISRLGEEFRAFNEDLRFTTRLDLGLAYTVLWQHASVGEQRNAASGDFDFFGTWHAVGELGRTAGLVGFAVEYRHDFGGITPSELNAQFGSLLNTARSFNDNSAGLKQIWWQQHLANGQFYMRIGDIDQNDFFSTNRFQSANFFFLNEAFAESLAVPFPDAGLGVVAFGFPNESVYIGAGIGDASPSSGSIASDSLSGEVFAALEVGLLTEFEGLGTGHYRLTVSHTDAVPQRNKPSGEALAISIDQELGRFVPFTRLAFSEKEGLTSFRKIVTAGFGLEEPFGNPGDEFGVAAAWAQPSDAQLSDEWVIESFYRIQLSPTLQFTPDLQFIINPSSGTKDVVVVGGLRLRIQY
jgi:hypothetical protein